MSALSAILETTRPIQAVEHRTDAPIVYSDLRTAVQSSSDFNMLQSLAGAMSGIDRFFDPHAPFTVFAPRNVAFTRFPRSLLNEIWIPGNAIWPHVFWNHIAQGCFKRDALKDGQVIQTIDGGQLHISLKGGALSVDGIPVLDTLTTPSSVVYVIDSLLIPASERQEFQTRKL
jgi:uncharacterized surface protein with fasciclin (FAS1) repeats